MAAMRVAFVSIENPEDPQAWSGIPYFVLRALRAAGLDVEVIAPLDQRAKYLLAADKLIGCIRHQAVQLDRHPLLLRSYARQIEARLRGRGFDVVFSTSSIPISALAPGLPVVFWTDAVFEALSGYYHGSFSHFSSHEAQIAHRQEQAALDRASFAVYSSHWAAAAAMSNYRAPQEKLQVLRFGANLPVTNDREEIDRLIATRMQGECKLLFIGVEWKRKGGPIAMEATRILRERGLPASLTVVGCQAPEAGYVRNLGFISKRTPDGQRQIGELLRESDIFLFPTRAEASAIVFCEASGFGLPIITTATGGTEDYVKSGATGYCLPPTATAEAYADRIQAIFEDPVVYRRLAWGAYEEFCGGLNWDAGASRLAELFALAALPQNALRKAPAQVPATTP